MTPDEAIKHYERRISAGNYVDSENWSWTELWELNIEALKFQLDHRCEDCILRVLDEGVEDKPTKHSDPWPCEFYGGF